MSDLKIEITADAQGAIAGSNQAATALQGTAEATRALTDETERYNAALRQMALSSKLAQQAQKQSVDDSERYQATLQSMAERQEAEQRSGVGDGGWFSGVQERRAAVIASLRDEGKAGADANRTIAQETEKVIGKKSELRQVIQHLTMEFPLLRGAAMLALNPIVGVASTATLAFSFLKGKIQEFEAQLSDTEWGHYGRKAGIAAEQLRKVESAAKDAEAANARLMDVFRARQTAEERLANARKELELSQAQGEQDPVKKAQRVLEIESRYARQQFEREERARAFGLQQQEQRAKSLREQAGKMTEEEKVWLGFSKRVGTPQEAREKLTELEKRLKTTQDARAKQEEIRDKNIPKILPYVDEFGSVTPVANPWTAMVHTEAGREASSFSAQEQALIREVERARLYVSGADEVQSRVDSLRTNREEALQSAGGIEAMLPTQRAVAAIESQSGRQVLSIGEQTRMNSAANEATVQARQLLQKMAEAIESNKTLSELTISKLNEWQAFTERLQGQISAGRTR